MSKLKLTIVAPVYNEEKVIAHFYERTRAVLDSIDGIEARILFVVDKSTDATLDILRAIVAKDPCAKTIALSSRFGHQMSLLAGIEHASDADVIIMMDSDLQHPPELIPKLLEEYHKGSAIVYTIRLPAEDVGLIRKCIGGFFYRLLNLLSPTQINPNAADFRLINRQVANSLVTSFKERNVFLRGLFSWIGFKQTGVEYKAERRFAGDSKYSVIRLFRFAITAILAFSARPLYISIFIGIGFASISFLIMISTFISYFVDHNIPSGWTTLVILLLLFSGVQLIVFGIMGAYIAGIYEEVKGRPRYIIDEEIVNLD